MVKCGMHSLVLGGCQSQCPLLCLSSKVTIGNSNKNTHFPFIELNPLTITPYSNSQQRHTRSCWIGLAWFGHTCQGLANSPNMSWLHQRNSAMLVQSRHCLTADIVEAQQELFALLLFRSILRMFPLGGT